MAGEFSSQTFVPRGNSTMSHTTSTGGILGTGGTSQTMTVATGIQFNQGNIAKVFNNPSVNDTTKIELAKALPLIINPPTQPVNTASRTTYAAGAVGPNAMDIKPESTGVDKIVDKVAQNADVIKDVANTAIDTTGKVTQASILATILASKWLLIIIAICIVIVLILIVILLIHAINFLISYFKTRKVTATTLGGKVVVTSQKIPENTFISNRSK